MEEGLLLDGVDIFGDDLPVDEAVEDAIAVLPDAADPPIAGIDPAAVGAERASHSEVGFLFDTEALHEPFFHSLTTPGTGCLPSVFSATGSRMVCWIV